MGLASTQLPVYNEGSSLITNMTLWGRGILDQMVEERQETCSAVSKIVKIKIIWRRVEGASLHESEIVSFECGASSSNCLSRCNYRLLMDDY